MKLRLYAISMMAFAPFDDSEHPGQNTLSYHTVALLPAQSIEDAAEQSRQHCFNLWKPEEGWYSHQAAILPVTKQFFDLALATHKEGAIDKLTTDLHPALSIQNENTFSGPSSISRTSAS